MRFTRFAYRSHQHHRFDPPTYRILTLALLLAAGLGAQVRPTEGLHSNTPRVFALTGATVHTEPGKVLTNATIVIRDGPIEAVGRRAKVPADAVTISLEGKTVYAGFIEAAWQPAAPRRRGGGFGPGPSAESRDEEESEPIDLHWNSRVRPSKSVLDDLSMSEKDLQALQQLGFTVAHVISNQGLFRGRSALIHLSELGADDPIKTHVTQTMAFESGRIPNRQYPASLLGAIALIRQTILDAGWYAKAWDIYRKNSQVNEQPEINRDLEALSADLAAKKPFLFDTDDELAILRAGNIAREFSLSLWVLGNGYEYRRLQAVKSLNSFLILPLNYPEVPKVTSLEEELQVSLAALRHWDQAPDNLQRLTKAGVTYAITSSKLKDRKKFRANLARSIERGLSAKVALAALTTVPAGRVGLASTHGKIAKGFTANLVVTDGDYFDKENKVLAVWIAGDQIEFSPDPVEDVRGDWTLSFPLTAGSDTEFAVKVKGEAAKPKGHIALEDDKTVPLEQLAIERDFIMWTLNADSLGQSGVWRFSGTQLADRMTGTGRRGDGSTFIWSAARTAPFKESEGEGKKDGKKSDKGKKEDKPEQASTLRPLYPEGAFGRTGPPSRPAVIFVKNATIWTMGPSGIIERGNLLIEGGKITAVGANVSLPRRTRGTVVEIDGTGKHVTPGLIDAHSHSAMASVNEGSQAVTAEVRIRDVTNSDDINIYRQLAGGLTMANGLHGSANPIGGQNAVIKFKWGALPADLIESRAPQGIKFALGENVKRSRSSSNTRYPDTRMGVDQIIRDAFQTATEYDRDWTRYNRSSSLKKTRIPPRRDLELEALVEVLKGTRLVHAHSYRQDEILNLIRIADDFGFTIAVFTHILEGYKVAPEMAKHGAGGSTFSDWWGYKFEVIDAIPFNGALMTRAGVLTSFNSDDGELATRLNTEAAKAIRYGGLSEEEALKLVTINPAKQLKVDRFTGSLEKGKDADFVIWSGNPLSTYSRAEQTWIEGRKYFDREDDAKLRQQQAGERAELIQKALVKGASAKGAKGGNRK